jgi:hypothetical protein
MVDVLKVKDENSRIRIHWSQTRIHGSGSVPKCHGSTTLVISYSIVDSLVLVDLDRKELNAAYP